MEDGLAALRRHTAELEELGDTESLAEALFLLGMHLSWNDAEATEALEKGARIAHGLGNLHLEAACIGWLCVDAFWYDASVDSGLELCARLLDRSDAGSETGRVLLLAGNFKRMAGREAEGLADVDDGTAYLMELGRMVDAHAYAMSTACVSLLGGAYEDAERVLVPAREALSAYGESGYLSTVAGVAALSLAWQGRYDEAEPLVNQARALGAEDDSSTQAIWRAATARVLAGRGEFDRACELAAESVAILGPRRLFDRGMLGVSAAEVHRDAGRLGEARTFLDQALDARRQKGILIGREWMQALSAEL
jgi:tetratricopeptide (TPR) repeat protein